MKKIAILYPAHYEQSNGGAELQISYFAKAAVNVGHEVHYVYENKNKPIQNELGLVLHPVNKIKDIKFCGKGWFRYRKAINKVLESVMPDVVYTRLGSSWIDIAAQYARKYNKRHIHALASDNDVSRKVLSSLFPFFTPVENIYINRGLKNVDLALAQNAYQEEVFQKKFHKPCVLIDQMTPLLDEALIKKDNDLVKILWIGNFKKVKRPELFVELAKKMKAYSHLVKMEMYGRLPADYKALLDEINKIPWLEYKGEVPTDVVLDKLSQSHLLVNTSLYEGFSNTFVQAWMRKVPVISMGSNPNNVFNNYNVGFYVPQENELLSTIANLIDHREVLNKMAEDSYSYAVEHHSLEKNMPKILNVL